MGFIETLDAAKNSPHWKSKLEGKYRGRGIASGFSEGIFNHLTLVVPGQSDRYYQIPFGTHWSEVTASCFMEVGIDDGEVKRGEGEVERSCYCIHAPIHKALPQAKAVFHTHMPYASALTRLDDPRIRRSARPRSAFPAPLPMTTNIPVRRSTRPKARVWPA